jgi:CHAT domain-containing protein
MTGVDGATVDIEKMRAWMPLPETADELCEVGRQLGVSDSDILLGSRATETMLTALSDSGQLADYAISHFATHGAMTGEVSGSAQPGLILTPFPTGSTEARALEQDDGFLAVSEIATLKLDADWVVVSACNTASGSAEAAETLSGSFLRGSTRAARVTLGRGLSNSCTIRAFAELKAKPIVGRAEALRICMRELIENVAACSAPSSPSGGYARPGASFAVGTVRRGWGRQAVISAS